MTDNIAFQSSELARYFTQHRVSWPQFYESERRIISQLELDARQDILDIGCGCGGLGLALRDQFGVDCYTGVEINPQAAEAGRQMNPRADITCGDILDVSANTLHGRQFDVVFSLSCVDWNVRFADMLAAAWTHVRPGGHLVSTFRLTVEAGCNDLSRSYQYINANGVMEGELAPYVVLNARDLTRALFAFDPAEISAIGYWGRPSATAVTPYEKLCFSAFSVRRRTGESDPPRLRLELPGEIVNVMDAAGVTRRADGPETSARARG